jgi:hypothetical protein
MTSTDLRSGAGRAGTRSAATPHAAPDPVLHDLLDQELAYDPVARRGFINHTSMALVAARRLGATDDQLASWFRGDTSSDFLVERDRPDWLVPDAAAIAARGAADTTAAALPRLVGAPGSQFLHAVIRLELALDAGHDAQVANALRNWADHSRPLSDQAPRPSGTRTFADVLTELAELLAAPDDRLRDLGVHDLAADPEVRAVLASLHDSPTLLDEVAAAVAAVHLADDSFGTLHLVTGTRAIRAVGALADDDTAQELRHRTAEAIAVLWLSFGAPRPVDDASLDEVRRRPTADWSAIGRAAIASGDAHVVKLVYAARLEEAATGDPLYRALAARQAGLDRAGRG